MSDFAEIISGMEKKGELPNNLTQSQIAAIERSLQNYAADLGEYITAQALERIKTAIATAAKNLANPHTSEEPLNPATAREAVMAVVQDCAPGILQANNIDFALQVARDIVAGAAGYVRDASPDVVSEYPAWELVRMYDRDVPRGMRRGDKGELVPDPGQSWDARWTAAGGTLIDGRMIALKSDPIWQALGDGVGGYTDTLGNPFPPFAFNSGYDVENVSRKECLSLGLIGSKTAVAPPAIDFSKLFSLPKIAAL